MLSVSAPIALSFQTHIDRFFFPATARSPQQDFFFSSRQGFLPFATDFLISVAFFLSLSGGACSRQAFLL